MDWDKVKAQRSGNNSNYHKSTTSSNDSDLWSRVKKQRKAEAVYNSSFAGRLNKSLKRFKNVYSDLYSSADSTKWQNSASYDKRKQQIGNVIGEIDGYIHQIEDTTEGTEYLDTLKGIKKEYSSLQGYLSGLNDYFSQWENENAYNYWLDTEEKKKKYAAMTNEEIEAEIDRLNSDSYKVGRVVTKAINGATDVYELLGGDTKNAEYEKMRDMLSSNDYTDSESSLQLLQNERLKRKYEEIDTSPEDVQALIEEYTELERKQDEEKIKHAGAYINGMFSRNPLSTLSYSPDLTIEPRMEEIKNKLDSLDPDWENLIEYNRIRSDEKYYQPLNEEAEKFADEHPVLSSASSVVMSPLKAWGAIGTIENAFDNNDAPVNANAPWYIANNLVNTQRETVMENYDWVDSNGKDWFDTLYSTGMSTADSLFTSAITGGSSWAGGALLGVSAASETAQQVALNGGTKEQALITGLFAGVNEMLWEKISLGNFNALTEKGIRNIFSKKGIKTAIGNILKSAGVNFSEEATTEATNLVVDYLVNGGASSYAQAYEIYRSAGYSDTEARTKARMDMVTQVGEAGFSGALQGLFMGGTGTAIGSSLNTVAVNEAAKNMTEADIVALQKQARALGLDASDIDVGSAGPWGGAPSTKKVANLISAVQDKQAQTDRQKVIDTAKSYGLNVSLYNTQTESGFKALQKSIGNIEREITASVNEQADNIYRNALADRIQELGESRGKALYIADSYIRAVDGKSLDEYREASLNSEAARIAINEFNSSGENTPQWVLEAKEQIENVYTEAERRYITPVHSDTVETVIEKSNDNSNDNKNVITNVESTKKGIDNTIETKNVAHTSAVVNGESVEVEGIGNVGESGATVLINGKEVDINYVTFDNPSTEAAYNFASGMDTTEKAKAALELYNPKFDNGSDYKTAFNEYYNAGLKGIGSFKDVDKYYTFAHSFPESWREAVFNAGRSNKIYKSGVNKLYKTRNLSKTQKSQLKVLDLLGKKYGISFLVFDNLVDSNGALSGLQIAGTNKVAVSLEADGKLYLRTAGHECFHIIEEWNPEAATELTGKIINYLKQTEGYNYSQLVQEYARRYGVDANTAEGLALIHSEMAADSMFDVFSNEKFIKDIVTENRTLAQKIRDFLTDLISELREMITHFHASEEMNALRNQTAVLEDINASFISALETATKNMKETLSDKTKNTATRSGVRYSVSGIHSKTADISLMDKAKNMLDSGVDSETVRKKTGWYIGYDGAMRYEIDDSKMTLIRQGDEIINYGMLDELIKHDGLFEAYPELKYMRVIFQDLGGKLGSYSRQFRDINIDSSLKNKPEELKNVLVHEIQHAIQHIEDFTSGSSESYWEKQLKNNSDIGKTEKQKQELENLESEYHKIEKDNPRFFKEMLELFEMEPGIPRGKIDWDTLEQIEEDPIEWQHFDKKRDSISEKYGDNEVYNFFRLRDKIKNLKSNSKTARDLYWSTAGEIEARDTSKRLEYTAEKRKNTRPDIDRTDVVFADNSDIGFSLGRTTDNTPVVVVNDDILRNITNEKELIDTVKSSLGRYKRVPIKGQSIYFLRDTKNEYTNSNYTKWLKNNDTQMYQDKMRLAGHTQDIIYATTDYINEGLNHPRKDKIVDFARGNILIDVSGRKYSAEVVIGFTKKGICELYDIVHMTAANFEYKKEAVTEAMDSKESNRSVTTSNNNNISQDISVVNNKSMHNNSDDTKNRRSIKLTQKAQQDLVENPELKNAFQDLQNELGLTKGFVPEGKVIHKYAAQLKKDNPCGMSVAEIESDLREIYSVLSSMSGSEGYEYAADLTLNLAKKMLDSSRVLDDLNTEKKELRQRLTSAVKGHKWYLSPEMRSEIEYHYDSYGNFHKKAFGKGFSFSENSTDYLDSDWSELCAAVPELFDSDTPAVEQPLVILEAFSATEYEYGLFDDYQYDTQAKYIATDIMNNLAAVPEADTLIGKMKSSEYDRIAKLKSENAEKISELKKKYAEEIERTAAEEKTHYKLQIKQKIESEKAAKARKSIEITMVRLSGMLANGTKNRHIPLKLIDTVRDLCYSITLNRASQTELGKNIEKIESLYAALNDGKEGPDGETNNQFMKNAYDKYVHNLIHQLSEQLRHKSIGSMTLEELILVDETVKAVAHRVARGNELHIESRNEGVEETAQAISGELGSAKVKRLYKSDKLNDASDKIDHDKWKFLKPVYAWRMIGSDTFAELMNNIRKGEDTWAVDIAEAREKILSIGEKYHKDTWADDKKELTLASGDKFTFSVQQLMMLYVASQREQYIPHLIGHKRGENVDTEKGGFVFEDAYKIVDSKELIEDEKGKKKKVHQQHAEERKWRKRDAGTHHLTESDLDLFAETLTPEQKAYANEMRDYLAKDLAVKGNEITRQLYDINKFVEDKYFPIKVAQEYLDGTPIKETEVRSLLSTSIMKDLTDNANAPILLRDFDDMWAEHVQQMAMFHSFALPLDDFTRVFNCRSSNGSPASIKSRIETACGKGAVSYIENFIKDVNGGVHASSTPTVMNKALSLFKKGAVFASASVAIQQPSAIARALAEVDIKYFAKTTGTGFKAIVSKKEYDELMKYAPIARVKSMGFFDNSIGQSTKEWLLSREYKGLKNKTVALLKDSSFRDDVLSIAPEKMDEITWCHLWNAVKAETADKYNLSGEALLKKSGERFSEVVELTQVYDSVFSKSEYMRSKDTGAKMSMAFMAEPTTALNMLVDAAAKLKHGDMKKGGRYIGAFVASVVFNNILKAFVTAARDDDEEKTYIEKYISSVAGGVATDINPLTLLPFVKDVLSIFNGYSIERADMSLVQDLYEAVESLFSDTESGSDKFLNLAGALAAFLGVPVKNVVRDIRATYNFAAGIFGFEKENEDGEKVPVQKSIKETSGEGIKNAIKDEFSEGFLNKVKNFAEETFFGTPEEQLYNAIKQGNYKAYEKLLKEEYEGDSTKVNTAIRSGLINYDERVTKAAEARRDGNSTLHSQCVKGLSADGFSNENIRKAVDKVYNELMDDGEETEKNEKAYSLYTYEDLNNAIETGGDVQGIIDDIVSAAVQNGKTDEEAKESIRNQVTSYWKPLYLEASDYEQEEIKKLLDDTELYSDLDNTLYGWEKDYTTEKYKSRYLEASRTEKERIISELEDTGLYSDAAKTARGWEVAVLKEEYKVATSQTEKDRIKAEIWNTGYYKYYSGMINALDKHDEAE